MNGDRSAAVPAQVCPRCVMQSGWRCWGVRGSAGRGRSGSNHFYGNVQMVGIALTSTAALWKSTYWTFPPAHITSCSQSLRQPQKKGNLTTRAAEIGLTGWREPGRHFHPNDLHGWLGSEARQVRKTRESASGRARASCYRQEGRKEPGEESKLQKHHYGLQP